MNYKNKFMLFIALNSSISFAQEISTNTLKPITVLEESGETSTLENAIKTLPRNAGEILNIDSSIDVAGGSANAKRLYIRGISESFTNITIDGAKQSKDLFQHRGGLNNIDVELLKRVEVEAGVAPADKGPGNLGGTIIFETVDAQDLLKDGKNIGGFVSGSYGSVDESYKGSLAAYGKVDEVGILIYGSKSDSEDYETGDGLSVDGSAEEVENYLLKLSALDINGHSIKISHEQNTQEGLYISSGPGSDFGYSYVSSSELEKQKVTRKTSILNYAYNPENNLINTQFKAYKNDTKIQYSEKTNLSDIESDIKGLDLRNTFSFDTNSFSNRLTVGVDYEKEEGESSAGSISLENIGVFAQNRMDISDFKLSFGLRYDNYENDFIYRTNKGDEISGNTNIEYFINDSISLFAGYGTTISGSNTIPIGWLTYLDPNLTFNGSSSQDLESQKSKKIELGANYRINNILNTSDSFGANIIFFNTKIENPIVVGTGGIRGTAVSDIINDEDIESKGIELSTSYEINKLKTVLTYSHSKVEQGGKEIIGTTRRLAGSSGDKIVADFTYRPQKNIMLGYTLTSVLKNNAANEGVNNSSGYALHDLQISYTPERIKNLLLSLSLNNIFDKNYAAQTSLTYQGLAVEEPGRDIRLSLKYTF